MTEDVKGFSGEPPRPPLKEPSKTLVEDDSDSIMSYGVSIDKALIQTMRSLS